MEGEKMMPQLGKKYIAFSMLAMIFLLTLLPFLISYLQTAPWEGSFGIDAFLQATFFPEFSAIVALGALSALFIAGKLEQAPIASPIQKEVLPFAFAEFPALIGFVLSFINKNAYLVVPFSLLSFLMWLYFYSRRGE